MLRTSRTLAAAALAAALVTAAGAAQALQIIQPRSFTLAGGLDIVGFQEFDPALGTLDSVNVDIDGVFAALVPVQASQPLTPLLDLDFIGAGGRGFNFSGPGARFQQPTILVPEASVEAVAASYSIDFTFTPATDLIGGPFPSVTVTPGAFIPPLQAIAMLDDFIQGIAAIGISETLLFTPVNFSPLGGIDGGGSIILTYNYTPAVVAMPEPAGAAALGLGLAGLAWLRRRRRAA